MPGLQTINEHLHRHYGINGDVELVPTGRASNYRVSSGGSCWLFKVFQQDYTPAGLSQASDFVTYLARSGYPVQESVPSHTGARVTVLDGRAAVLIPWMEGDTPEPNTVISSDALGQIGALCGRIHRLGSEYPGAETLEYAGRVVPGKASAQRVADKRASLLALAAQTRDAEIESELGTRMIILDGLGEALAVSQEDARQGVIHGDFFCSHVVFRQHRAVGVIDVLGPRYLPGWELMRGFFQSVPSVFESPRFDGAPWTAYLAGYASECPIGARAVAVAYDAYLLQLTTSTYGLRQPLDEGLREFGRWRTRLAQYLAEHREEVRSVMAAAMTS